MRIKRIEFFKLSPDFPIIRRLEKITTMVQSQM